MKNLHILKTKKPSRLRYYNNSEYILSKGNLLWADSKNIYITSDEEIKKGDWIFSIKTNNLFKADSIEFLESHNMIEDFDKSFYINSKYAKKIILTTDPKLIADGVQPIDDEFLEWFVKNPSCEWVEAKLIEEIPSGFTFGMFGNDEPPTELVYKIIIPKEELTISDEAKQRAKNYMSLKGALEPKQETLEEANWKVLGTKKDTFYNGAKWQAERMYSEEGVLKILRQFNKDKPKLIFGVEEWFEQFKKK